MLSPSGAVFYHQESLAIELCMCIVLKQQLKQEVSPAWGASPREDTGRAGRNLTCLSHQKVTLCFGNSPVW